MFLFAKQIVSSFSQADSSPKGSRQSCACVVSHLPLAGNLKGEDETESPIRCLQIAMLCDWFVNFLSVIFLSGKHFIEFQEINKEK